MQRIDKSERKAKKEIKPRKTYIAWDNNNIDIIDYSNNVESNLCIKTDHESTIR